MVDKRHTHVVNVDGDAEVTIKVPRKDLFFRFMHWVVDSGVLAEMPPPAAKVYLVIGRYSDFTKGVCTLSAKKICREAGVSRSSWHRSVSFLVDKGLISRISGSHHVPDRPDCPNKYRVHPEDPSAPETQGDPPQTQGGVPQGHRASSPKKLFFRDSVLETPDRDTATAERLLRAAGFVGRTLEDLAGLATGKEVLLEALLRNVEHLTAKGKIRSRPGYIRKGLEEGYDLLPELAGKDLQAERAGRTADASDKQRRQRLDEQEKTRMERQHMLDVIGQIPKDNRDALVRRAIEALPAMLRQGMKDKANPLNNPFVRAAVYDLAKEEIAHGH